MSDGRESALEGRPVDCITGSTDIGSDSWVDRLGRRVMEVGEWSVGDRVEFTDAIIYPEMIERKLALVLCPSFTKIENKNDVYSALVHA